MVQVGQREEQIKVEDRRLPRGRRTVGQSSETSGEYEPAARYQETADRLGISLEAALTSLPRAEMAIEACYVSDNFHSIRVRCSITRTLPDFGDAAQTTVLCELTEAVDDQVKETVNMLRDRLETDYG